MMKQQLLFFVFALTTLLAFTGCSGEQASSDGSGGTTAGNPSLEDISTSGSVAGAIGGALSGTSTGGTLAAYQSRKHLDSISFALQALGVLPQAMASGSCPTFLTTAGVTCAASGDMMELLYNDCNFTGSQAEWFGALALIQPSGTPTCGTFPPPSSGSSLIRQYIATGASPTPSHAIVVSSFGTSVTIDDATTNLGNFDSQTIATLVNGGYGTKVTYNGSSKRSGLTLAERIVTGNYDHSISGSLSISETTSSTRSVSGSVSIYHNLARVVGTSVLASVVHEDMCCLPVSGSITTTFSAGVNVAPTTAGSLLVGHSETLTFTGCGTATLLTTAGVSKTVALSRCF